MAHAGVLRGVASGSVLGSIPLRDAWLVTYFAVSLGLGVFMGRLIERPMLAWRDRLFPSRTRTGIATDWQEESRAAEGPSPAQFEPRRPVVPAAVAPGTHVGASAPTP